MSQRSGYDPGVPCWVDLSSTDVAASARFYGAIFGWEADMVDDPAAGGYGMFVYQGKKVAGLGPVMAEGMPSAWNTYVATDDVAALAGRVREAGGTVVMEPMAVFEEGSMAVFRAPDGSHTGAWQAGNHHGAELVNEPVSLCWNELVSRDPAAAERFYSTVFGWRPELLDMGGMKYTEWHSGEPAIAGMMEMPADYPQGTPSFWMTYFAVADLDATTAAAERAGAAVLVRAMDAPPGPFSALMDPQGAVFSIIQLHETS
ncbi:VOC family protein [Nonomuraea sp. SYSU D8015]|uniref:VOC family protein n=1 Tax=Nonomuraea sp. SYSU D8015 TaxID=2593644 RepID=UPI0016601BB9|nr:VOC family protein [Nonomuraea sp. SYSU D8015]